MSRSRWRLRFGQVHTPSDDLFHHRVAAAGTTTFFSYVNRGSNNHEGSGAGQTLASVLFDIIYTLPFTGAHIVRLEEALLAHTSGGGAGAQNIAALLTAQTTSQEAVINECNAAALMLVSRLMHRLLLQPCQVSSKPKSQQDVRFRSLHNPGCSRSQHDIESLCWRCQHSPPLPLAWGHQRKDSSLVQRSAACISAPQHAGLQHICTITTTRSIELFVHEGANPV